MNEISKNQQNILNLFVKNKEMSSSMVHEEFLKKGEDISQVTIKRELSELRDMGLLTLLGAGRSVMYALSTRGRLFLNIDIKDYSATEPDRRSGLRSFNFDLFKNMPEEIFSKSELEKLEEATIKYNKKLESISKTLEEKELERFVIELSWKSSKIEGNTYTLLDTEKLIVRGVEAVGHDKKEAKMILNHKNAFKFIRENASQFKNINLREIEDVHKILVDELDVNHGLRNKPVGVTGSIYKPLDNSYQIKEALEDMCSLINNAKSPYSKALIALICLSYIQAFEDGNKRTARLITNAILLSHKCSPLSYRSVDENDYRNAILVFYEINSLVALKNIFIEQYIFASENYLVEAERAD